MKITNLVLKNTKNLLIHHIGNNKRFIKLQYNLKIINQLPLKDIQRIEKEINYNTKLFSIINRAFNVDYFCIGLLICMVFKSS